MESRSYSLSGQVQWWAALGPLVIALALIIAQLRFSSLEVWLPLATLLTAPLCVRWGMKALAGSLLLLTLVGTLGYLTLPLEERFWHVGFGMALSLGLVVTTLCFEEVRGLLQQVQRESSSRLSNLLRMDEKLRQTQDEWFREKGELLTFHRHMEGELKEKEERLNRLSRFFPSVQADMDAAEARCHQLLEELYREKQASERHLSGLRLSEKKLEEIRALYTEKRSVREETLSQRVEELERELEISRKAHDEWAGRLENACAHLDEEKGLRAALQEAVQLKDEKASKMRQRWVQSLHTLNEARSTLFQLSLNQQRGGVVGHMVEELEVLRRSVNRWEGMYRQLRSQFLEKGKILDETRAQLFTLENQKFCLERELWDQELDGHPDLKALQSHLVRVENELAAVEQEGLRQQQLYEELISRLMEETAVSVSTA